jgi:hypothetical protein
MRIRNRDERGASLILAIGFTLIATAVGAGVITMVASGLGNRVNLDNARNGEYAADAAIQQAIVVVRQVTPTAGYLGPALSGCPAIPDHTSNSITIHVDCAPAPARTRTGYLQQNLVFTTCKSSDASGTPATCNTSKIVTRAQVNFQATGSGTSFNIQRTWVQSWSVNG